METDATLQLTFAAVAFLPKLRLSRSPLPPLVAGFSFGPQAAPGAFFSSSSPADDSAKDRTTSL